MINSGEKNCLWHFAEQSGGREDGPNDAKLENFKQYAYQSLIRESIQNSLDAVDDEQKPVIVRFSLEEVSTNEYPNFLGLAEHVAGCLSHFPKNEDAKRIYKPMHELLNSIRGQMFMTYVKVSDFNTKGMEYKKGDTNCPFYAFVRSAGVTSKSNHSAGGSFGFGKAAYFNISPISTVIVSTKTKKGNYWFEGVSSLCTHDSIKGKKTLMSVGYYDNNDGQPIGDINNIPTDFIRKENGTDTCLMGVQVKTAKEKIEIFDEMKEAVLRHFWLSIYEEKLVVEIGGEIINKKNLEKAMKDTFQEESDDKKSPYQYNPRPYLDAVINAGKDRSHIFIRKQLDNLGTVRLYIKKNKYAPDKILFMRAPRMLVYSKRYQSSNGYYGIFICDDNVGNELLRRTENPAHNEWKETNWQDKGRTSKKAKEVIEELKQFITDSIADLFSSKNKNLLNIKGLDQLLYIPTEVEADEDNESQSSVGQPTGDIQNEGESDTTALNPPPGTNTPSNTNVGTVTVGPIGSGSLTSGGSGRAGGGSGKKRSGKPKTGSGTQGGTSRGSTDENGENEIYQEIPVNYRSFAQEIDGSITHVLIIRVDHDVEKGRIAIVSAGEDDDAIVNLRSCNNGNVSENEITNVTLQKGKNTLLVKFQDNYKHSIKLTAYEPE